jgi:predicted NAD/FAD-dependent oxidoreductase
MPGTVGGSAAVPPAPSTGGSATRTAGRARRGYRRAVSTQLHAEVVVVGAGLAGLSAATRLAEGGLDVHVLESSGSVGGRLASERIDGFAVDRGFQVFNTGYPRAADLDLPALELGFFERGAVVRVDSRVHRVRYSPDGRALVSSSTLEPTREAEVRAEIAAAHGVAPSDLEHLTSVTVPRAQPAALPPLQLRRPVDLGHGVYVCGDHRDTPSIQGAMASGARAARAVLAGFRPPAPDDRRAG